MYRIQLQEFEGPLDLLLYFIRRDEVDIFDIPIARIADEYLGYVQSMQQVDLDTAGEFVYMAALLISIKTKMLLPRQEVDDDGEPIDPRRELVERLLAYIRFKEASVQLESLKSQRDLHFTRGEAGAVAEAYANLGEPTYQVSIFSLISALQRVLKKVEETPVIHHIKPETYTIEQQELFLMEAIREKSRLSFVEICQHRNKSFVITTFLAVLEMARAQKIRLETAADDADFFLIEVPQQTFPAETEIQDANATRE